MSRQNLVALTVTTLLGVAIGGFVLWKGIQRRRRSKTSPVTQQPQQKVLGSGELPPPEDDQLRSSAPRSSWEERILKAKVVTVSQEAEWDQIEPLLRSELQDFLVLGIDCEWKRPLDANPVMTKKRIPDSVAVTKALTPQLLRVFLYMSNVDGFKEDL
ncbi:Exonuclease 3'-5' domain-containing protein 2 [Saguinus oedipus]|uniref:Exonuclease 3'-5' domain-containing protein 2 n=1 Tax=Saguinus oedipus TaxID=9490 RepID=A0ABQ9V4V3_SAGOE|nr:Exonuclease 3'-5' domain-containing protein 2 [Saguinus oedipus]